MGGYAPARAGRDPPRENAIREPRARGRRRDDDGHWHHQDKECLAIEARNSDSMFCEKAYRRGHVHWGQKLCA